jgi:hypothetical protein
MHVRMPVCLYVRIFLVAFDMDLAVGLAGSREAAAMFPRENPKTIHFETISMILSNFLTMSPDCAGKYSKDHF